jgi:hypothetical protein
MFVEVFQRRHNGQQRPLSDAVVSVSPGKGLAVVGHYPLLAILHLRHNHTNADVARVRVYGCLQLMTGAVHRAPFGGRKAAPSPGDHQKIRFPSVSVISAFAMSAQQTMNHL